MISLPKVPKKLQLHEHVGAMKYFQKHCLNLSFPKILCTALVVTEFACSKNLFLSPKLCSLGFHFVSFTRIRKERVSPTLGSYAQKLYMYCSVITNHSLKTKRSDSYETSSTSPMYKSQWGVRGEAQRKTVSKISSVMASGPVRPEGFLVSPTRKKVSPCYR